MVGQAGAAVPLGPFQKLTGPSQPPGGTAAHWYPAPVHCGSAQSTSPSQLSSTPLLQSSVVPPGHEQVPAAEHTCPTPGHFPPSVPQVIVPPQLFAIVPHTLPAVHAVSGVQQLFGAGPDAPSQICGGLHEPQEGAVCVMPQLLVPVTDPHVAFRRPQKDWSLSSVQPHAPLALQVLGNAHGPQELTVRLVPQLSGAVTDPQTLPSRAHIWGSVSGVQHRLAVVHTMGVAQPAQGTTVPQLSFTIPHFPAQVIETGSRGQPHTLAVVAPQPWLVPVPHRVVPQLMAGPLQPSAKVPQLEPGGQVVIGLHPH